MNGENYEHMCNCDSCERMTLETAREYLCDNCKKEIECTQMTQRWMLFLEDAAQLRDALQETIQLLKQEREENGRY